MDLSKELAKLKDNEDNLEMVLAKIEKEKQIYEQKLHIFSMMKCVKKLNLLRLP